MATPTTTTGNGPARGAVGGDGLRVEPPRPPGRRSRRSWIALGVVVSLGLGLFGATLVARVADREAVLALAQPIERGETLTAEHLRTVEVAADGQAVALARAGQRSALVGQVATGDLPAGALVSPELFANAPAVPEGWQVVGLALEPGAYPTADLATGDQVAVLRTPGATDPTGPEAEAGEVLVERARVVAFDLLSETSQTRMVSLALPAEAAPAVAAAAARDQVRLGLVGPQ